MSIEDDLKALPLEGVRQLHLHRAGTAASGALIDTHEALRDEEQPIVEWLLAHTLPDIVTQEYWRDHEAIREQLYRLRANMNTSS